MGGAKHVRGMFSGVALAEVVQYTLHRSGGRAAFRMLATDTAGWECNLIVGKHGTADHSAAPESH